MARSKSKNGDGDQTDATNQATGAGESVPPEAAFEQAVDAAKLAGKVGDDGPVPDAMAEADASKEQAAPESDYDFGPAPDADPERTSGRAKLPAVPVGRTREELDASWRLKRPQQTLTEGVSVCYNALRLDPKFQRLMDAIEDGRSVYGRKEWDQFWAVKMIQDYAQEHRIDVVVEATAKQVERVLNVVMGRYGQTRAQRYRVAKQLMAKAAE